MLCNVDEHQHQLNVANNAALLTFVIDLYSEMFIACNFKRHAILWKVLQKVGNTIAMRNTLVIVLTTYFYIISSYNIPCSL